MEFTHLFGTVKKVGFKSRSGMQQQPHQFPRTGNDGSVQHKEANNDFDLLVHAEMLANQAVQL